MPDQILRTSQGEVDYTLPCTVTESTGKPIDGDPVWVSLGSYDVVGEWKTPDVVTHPTDSSVTVSLLLGQLDLGGSFDPPPGRYYVWVKLTDDPTIPFLRGKTISIE